MSTVACPAARRRSTRTYAERAVRTFDSMSEAAIAKRGSVAVG